MVGQVAKVVKTFGYRQQAETLDGFRYSKTKSQNALEINYLF